MVLELSPLKSYRKSATEDTLVEIIELTDSSRSPSRASSTSTAIEPTSFYGTSKSARTPSSALRKSERSLTRQSSSQSTRKRSLSIVQTESPQQLKKVKLIITSGVDKAFSEKKEQRDLASKRWLFSHRHLFLPLFAKEKNPYFEQLKGEAKGWKKDDKTFIPLQDLVEQPTLLKNGEMKDYQLHGLSFLVYMYRNGMNCILGDEMGLGKTLQTLSLFAYIREHTPENKHIPHLVICPLSVLSSWESECRQWFPTFKIIRFHGPEAERNRMKADITDTKKQFDLLLTTYDQFVLDDRWFKSRRWNFCVLDEGHRIKNSRSNLSSTLLGLGSLYRLILTGTPLQNNMGELWSLLRWLYPHIFRENTEREFLSAFNMELGSYDMNFLSAARKLLEAIMLRRTKAVVDVDVPPKEEMTVFIPLSEAQRFWTYRMLTKVDSVSLGSIFGGDVSTLKKEEEAEADEVVEIVDETTDIAAGRRAVLKHLQQQAAPRKNDAMSGDRWKKLMNLLMQLRKICDHPYLLPGAEPEPYYIGEHVVASSAKLVAIDKILADVIPRGEKVLIFSQWLGMLDLLEDFMALRSYRYARLDGSVPRPRRTLDIRLFQRDDSPYQIFLILTKAGGLGINLTKATHVIMCDTDWNPQNDLQAIARAHRIGQKKTVKVYRLICRASVEDQMLDRLRRKLFLSVKVMGGNGSSSSTSNDSNGLGRSELTAILRNGSSALSRTDDGMSWSEFLNAPLAKILEASKRKSEMRDAKIRRQVGVAGDDDDDESLLEDAEEEERMLLQGIARVRCNIFEGEFVKHVPQSNRDIAQEWNDLQKRARTNQLVTVMGMAFRVQENLEDFIITSAKAAASPQKRGGRSYESENWCIYCRDGGELMLCSSCPRVFHAKCAGMTKAETRKPSVYCGQHVCGTCSRNTGQCGGMMFRCRTCPQAFCEDCIPFDDIIPIGDSIPEFRALGYPAKSNAYYITCVECQQEFQEQPELLEEWEGEWAQAIEKLEALRAQ